ncbi:MAG: hypothetical protein IIA61_14220 [Candidatus Marinimicrobia bacterium]|nr:hypothetical protein [Candidatus Neomarinimicrobiota bacterium]
MPEKPTESAKRLVDKPNLCNPPVAEPNHGSVAEAVLPSDTTEGEEEALQRLLSLSRRRTLDDYVAITRLSARLGRRRDRAWDDKDRAELDALIAQYQSIREESLQTINNRVQIMMLGIAAIAALAGGSLTIEDPASSRNIIYAVFSGGIPLVSIFVLLVWAGEAMRSHRAGYFLAADVEAHINQKLGRFIMNWETALWAGRLERDEMRGPSMMAFAVIGVVALAAPWFGVFLSGTSNLPLIWPTLAVLVPYSFLGATALYLRNNMHRLRNIPVISSTFMRDDGYAARAE